MVEIWGNVLSLVGNIASVSIVGPFLFVLKRLEIMHFSGSRWCIGSLGRVTKRLFSAGKVLFRPPGTKVIVSKLAIVSSRKAPVWSRQELHHRRLPYSGSQHFGDLHTVFKAEHQIPILVNRHPVDQIQPKPVAVAVSYTHLTLPTSGSV